MFGGGFSGGPGWGGPGFGGPGFGGPGFGGPGFGGHGWGGHGGATALAAPVSEGTGADPALAGAASGWWSVRQPCCSTGPRTPSRLVQRVSEATDGAFAPPQEIVELAIGKLAGRGFVSVDDGVATLTELGRNVLQWKGISSESIHARLAQAGKFGDVAKIRWGLFETRRAGADHPLVGHRRAEGEARRSADEGPDGDHRGEAVAARRTR